MALFSMVAFNIFDGHSQDKLNVFSDPSWSPDGKRIAYASNQEGNFNIYIYDLNNNSIRQVTYFDSDERQPVWSPDGKNLAFTSNESGNRGIYILQYESKNYVELINTENEEITPVWDIDGMGIYYVHYNVIDQERILNYVNLDGRTKIISPDSSRHYIYPTPTRLKNQLIVASKDKRNMNFFHVFKINLETGQEQQLESMDIVSYNPNFSIPNEKIVFVNQSTESINSAAIFIMDIDGKNLRKIVECEFGCFQPRLSPDGSNIVYKNGWDDNNFGIYIFNIQKERNELLIGPDQ